eukprot:s1751_g13.t1
MLSFASRRCWAVLTARLPCRSFALVAGQQLSTEELKRLVDEARRPRKLGRPPKQVPTCSRLADEAASDVTADGVPEEPDYPTILRWKVQKLVSDAQRRSKEKGISCDLDQDFLFNLLLEQKGMCEYSGVDVELVGPRSNWLISLERLDNRHGYRRNNVALIAQEFNSMAGSAKKQSSRVLASGQGRRWHGDFELELDDVLGMLWAQRGRCFYSDVPLRYAQSNVDWLMSLERLDNTKTYTKENTCLVALEFNTRAQWSRGKVQFVWGNMPVDEETLDLPKFPPDVPSSFQLPRDLATDFPSIA